MKEKIKKFFKKTASIWYFLLACIVSAGLVLLVWLLIPTRDMITLSANADEITDERRAYLVIPEGQEFMMDWTPDFDAPFPTKVTIDGTDFSALCYVWNVYDSSMPVNTAFVDVGPYGSYTLSRTLYLPIAMKYAQSGLFANGCSLVFTMYHPFSGAECVCMGIWGEYSLSYRDDSAVYDQGYESGYQDGGSQGYQDGYSGGYNDGKSQGYNEGFDQGYTNGIDEGVNLGYENGYDEGYLDGETFGYENGYNVAKEDLYDEIETEVLQDKDTFLDLIFSIFDAPLRVVREVFSFELFGIDVSNIIMFALTGVIVVFVIRKIKGG